MKKLQKLQAKSIKKESLYAIKGGLMAMTSQSFTDTNCVDSGSNGASDCTDSKSDTDK
ncbi:hypothetical protein [Chryseobacterium rhizosphaerae]|uniref:hypothetical protein n=1 Tax=Chryseobacterium rhizosphaerae TaxID=395937 RepID=UPI00119745C4|nr:hypothetical protein [Chryseobacterium rhizosphaerae]GEN67688.1 hypothetical protein CRH01_22560 [Chryseobacterium rhizosphaerae]